MRYFSFFLLLLLFPLVTFAQLEPPDDIQEFTRYLVYFINYIFLPFLFSLALLFFIYNVFRYFFLNVNNYDGRENARRFALWSIIAFVLMVSIWGIVNLLVGGMGFDQETPICPDYLPNCDTG